LRAQFTAWSSFAKIKPSNPDDSFVGMNLTPFQTLLCHLRGAVSITARHSVVFQFDHRAASPAGRDGAAWAGQAPALHLRTLPNCKQRDCQQ
jgi:hypothetical protein